MRRTPAESRTRREFVAGVAALAGAGAVAGCVGNSSTAATETTRETDEPASDETAGGAEADGDGESRSVTMAPMGTVEFDGVPERAFVLFPQYADMAVALGRGDAVNSIYVPEMSGATMEAYYARLDGVSFEWEALPDPMSAGLTKELLYELDSDVHFVDPAYVSTQENWSRADIEGVAEHVGPWFGNFYSGTHDAPPAGYRDDYRYYDLWELFGKVAAVFDEEERYRALAAVHADLVSTIREQLPPESERPSAVRVTLGEDVFYTYHLNEPGYWLADTRPLGARDAFAERDWESLWGTVGYEAMLEADPDVILHLWGTTPSYDMDGVRDALADHPVGRELSAVENDRVHVAGMRYQGPLMNLFQLEMTAKQLYPERFGEWPAYSTGDPYPEIPEAERLFDRRRVAEIVTS